MGTIRTGTGQVSGRRVVPGRPEGGREMSLRLLALCLGALITFAGPAANAETYELRLAHFVTPKHSISIWLEKWAAELERKSDGALKITIFPAAQMGPTANHYDFVRTGRA